MLLLSKKLPVYTLGLFLFAYFAYQSESIRSIPAKYWFDSAAKDCSLEANIHHCSQWTYMDEEMYYEMIIDGTKRMNPPLKDHSRIYDLGMGVGAALKVLLQDYPHLDVGGSDYSESAIDTAKTVLPNFADQFTVADMTAKNPQVPDNTFDHVFSFGALGMYLDEAQMLDAVKEAIRITKPGGSILITHFIEPNSSPRRSIVHPISKSFWLEQLPKLGVTNIQIETMQHQGERYQIHFTKAK